ncbi:MAG: MBL fold metallo-hydrolase [Clostridiaceae bacterium]|nr:MBL fold metallo-hydrolase [Clostridiaceae bacterium]
MKIKIAVLVDNSTLVSQDTNLVGEAGASYYIEDENKKFLFDVGFSDNFYKNSKIMGIDLSKVDAIVLSHGHDDHIGGLRYMPEFMEGKPIVCHPDLFGPIYLNGLPIGCDFTNSEIAKKYNLILSREPLKLTQNLWYLGEIPRENNFEGKRSVGEKQFDSGIAPDNLLDDSALAYVSDKGLFIITGCSHCGICNIITYAKSVTGVDNVYGVIGGLHLLTVNENLTKTIEFLSKENIQLFCPCHCVALPAKLEMAKHMQIQEVGVGQIFEI